MAGRNIRQLTTGVHDFPTLINGKETKYVDKTALLYELAKKKEDAQYFISRPVFNARKRNIDIPVIESM